MQNAHEFMKEREELINEIACNVGDEMIEQMSQKVIQLKWKFWEKQEINISEIVDRGYGPLLEEELKKREEISLEDLENKYPKIFEKLVECIEVHVRKTLVSLGWRIIDNDGILFLTEFKEINKIQV